MRLSRVPSRLSSMASDTQRSIKAPDQSSLCPCLFLDLISISATVRTCRQQHSDRMLQRLWHRCVMLCEALVVLVCSGIPQARDLKRAPQRQLSRLRRLGSEIVWKFPLESGLRCLKVCSAWINAWSICVKIQEHQGSGLYIHFILL